MSVYRIGLNKSSINPFPSIRPTLDLNFAASKSLDSRIAFTRSSSGSYVGSDSLIKYAGVNEPRFDHDTQTGVSLGLMVEEGRTNLLLRNEEYDNNTHWEKTGLTIQSNSITAPDGTSNADKIVEDTSTSIHRISQTIAKSSIATTYTFSVFIKSGERNGFEFGILDDNGYVDCFANSTTGVFSGVPTISGAFVLGSYGSIAYPNGWYRFYVTATSTAQTSVTSFIGTTRSVGIANNYQGNGINGIYLWGAQLEEGTTPTSYIPTTSSSVTRSADNASIVGKNFSSWYDIKESTVYSEFQIKTPPPSSASGCICAFNDNTTNNRIVLFAGENSILVGRNTNNIGVKFTPSTSTLISGGINRSTFTFANLDVAVCGNGRSVVSETGYAVPSVNRLNIGSQYGNTSFLNGTISRLTYYPKRLSNSTLQLFTK